VKKRPRISGVILRGEDFARSGVSAQAGMRNIMGRKSHARAHTGLALRAVVLIRRSFEPAEDRWASNRKLAFDVC